MSHIEKMIAATTTYGTLDTIRNGDGTTSVVWLWRDCERWCGDSPAIGRKRAILDVISTAKGISRIHTHEEFAQSVLDGEKVQAHLVFTCENIAIDMLMRSVVV